MPAAQLMCQCPALNGTGASTHRLLIKPSLWILSVLGYITTQHFKAISHLLIGVSWREISSLPPFHPALPPLYRESKSAAGNSPCCGGDSPAGRIGFPWILLSTTHTAQRPHSTVSSKAMSRPSAVVWGRE